MAYLRWLLHIALVTMSRGDIAVCPNPNEALLPQLDWAGAGDKVKLYLMNWAGEPLAVRILTTTAKPARKYGTIQKDGGEMELRARVGSVIQLYSLKPKKLYFQRLVVPHDGSMGTTSIFSCRNITLEEETRIRALIVKSQCDDRVPTKDWVCVRPAPPVSDWPKDKYGFTAEEVKAVPGRSRIYEAGATTADTDWTVEPFTDPGYLLMKMPDDVYKALRTVYDNSQAEAQVEGDIPGHYSNFYGQRKKGNAWTFISLDSHQRERAIVSEGVRRILTWWTGKPMQHEATYGIRVYHDEAVLLNHRDVKTSHVISAVLNVNQTMSEGWPLYVERSHSPLEYSEVYLQPGYMALYEGARLNHGRPMRASGSEFAMAFTHNRPMDFYPHLANDRYDL